MISSEVLISSSNTIENICKKWNSNEISVQNGIYAKLPIHVAKHIKKWAKNQDRRDAEIASGTRQLYSALEHIPDVDQSHPNDSIFPRETICINNANDESAANDVNNLNSNEDEAFVCENESFIESVIQNLDVAGSNSSTLDNNIEVQTSTQSSENIEVPTIQQPNYQPHGL